MKALILVAITFVAIVAASNPGSLGPDKSKQLSGYITVPGFRNDNGTHLFYWFFESRNSPSTAPTILWLTGGPGCSSMLALFYENGPYIIQKNLSLSLNPYSWNEVANVIWIDQPVGTGYSYADHVTDYTVDETQIAEDLYEFLQTFFAQNPQYNHDFFVFGESYAGHYIPAVGKRIVIGNKKIKSPYVDIDLKGLAIGNGWVDPKIQYGYYADLLNEKGLLDAASTAAYDDTAYPACEALIDVNWFLALEECSLAMEAVLADAELQNGRTINVYDVTKKCEVEPLCYDFSLGTKFLTSPRVMKALGTNPKVQWVDCNMEVHELLLGDWIGNFAVDLPMVLAANIPVLVYSGTNDWICNYLGGEAWAAAMKWPGQKGYNNATWDEWTGPNGNQAGRAKTFSGLTFLEVLDAGHMVPMDQPANALDMVTKFVNGQPFGI